MKKLFLGLALMLTMVLTAQYKEDSRVYFTALIEQKGEKPETKEMITITYLFYQDKGVVKVILESGRTTYYDLLTEIKSGITADGYPYTYGEYNMRGEDDINIFIQVFQDSKLGIRFISNSVSIQYY